MAYKFTFGPAKLSGSTIFEEELVTSGSLTALGAISSSAAALLHSVNADEIFAQSASFGTAAQASISVAGAAVFASAQVSDLTDNRIVIAGSSGELEDDAKLTFDGADFTLGASTRLIAVDITGSGPALLHSVNADEVFAQSASFGTAAQTNIGTGGVISSSVGATINRLTVPTLIGDMSGTTGASLTLGGALDVGNSRLVVNENLILGTTNLHASGAFFSENALVVGDLAANQSRVAYFDMKGGDIKTCDFSVYASLLAGTGITATDGVLSVDTTGGDSMTSTHIPADAGGNAALISGLNFMTTAVTGSSLLVLPSASAGDVVIVKAPAGVNSTNFIKITSSVANGDEIDGFSEARIESPFGAVSLIYSNSDGQWVIY